MKIALTVKSIETSSRIEGTAWDLVGSLSEYWQSGDYEIFVAGKAIYTDAYNTKNDFICVWRLEALEDGLKITKRYLHPDTPVYVEKRQKREGF